MSECIYCRKPKPAGKQWPAEHVLPRAFGKFKNNLTLRCVCAECNHYFSTDLEIFLARDSHESYRRLQLGMKPISEAADLRGSRVSIIVSEGSWAGARIVLDYDRQQQKLVTVPLDQVAFRKPGASRFWFLEAEITDAIIKRFKGKGLEILILGSEEGQQHILKRLADGGVKFEAQEKLIEPPVRADGTIELEFESSVDLTICRAIAKISFNYLAYVKQEEFVLRPDFDRIRNFIRTGERQGELPVRPIKTPILYGETRTWGQTQGHLLTVDWDNSGDALIGQVSLFNTITYQIGLCLRFKGVWRELTSGHHFNINTMETAPLKFARITTPIRR